MRGEQPREEAPAEAVPQMPAPDELTVDLGPHRESVAERALPDGGAEPLEKTQSVGPKRRTVRLVEDHPEARGQLEAAGCERGLHFAAEHDRRREQLDLQIVRTRGRCAVRRWLVRP